MDRVQRRNFLIAAGAVFAAPIVARAQGTGKIPRVGFLFGGASGPSPDVDAFRRGLRERGYIEGQNIAVEYRFASGEVGQLAELAAELVRLKVEVIVAPSTPTALAAKRATSTIPIVFAVVADPLGAGLIANLARPGGNITGVTSSSAELGGKRLGLLKEVIPKASRVAVLYNPTDASNVLVVNQLRNRHRPWASFCNRSRYANLVSSRVPLSR
jgi:putative ABC transport system substrate-binding protein